jgi:DNA-binding SARP family transcriptional activator
VSLGELADGVWAGQPPDGARKSLQVLVHRLRGRVDAPDLVVTAGDGYRLGLAPEAIDAVRFEQLLAVGHMATEPEAALASFDEALALWRGEPAADLGDGDLGRAARAHLVDLRLAAEDERFDRCLALGRHLEVVADLEASLATERLRERRWRQLMLALHRSGRQADALGAYQRARRALVDELGVEPGPELRELEAAILRVDPALDLP